MNTDPTERDLQRPEFNAVWKVIKGWDIRRSPAVGYAGATGTDVMTILNAIKAATTVSETLPCSACGEATWNDEGAEAVLCLECARKRRATW